MLHAVVTCVLYKGTEKVDIIDKKDFGSDLITDIESAMSFLKQHLRVRYEIKDTARRKEIPEIPYSALREAVVNAVCHRDYFEKGARVTIEVFDDRVVITNPGGLPKGLDPSDFGTISLARNPNIAGILHRADYIERIGTGINRMKIAVAKAGLVKPEITHSNFFRITFSRKFLEQYEAISETVNEIANETVKKATNETVNETVNEIANETVKNSKKHHPISSKTEQNKDEKSVIILSLITHLTLPTSVIV